MGEYLKLFYKFLPFCADFKKYGIWAGIISLIVTFLQLPAPFLTRLAIDNIFPKKNFQLLNLVVIGFFILAASRALSNLLSGLLLFLFRTKVTLNIQQKLFEHLEYLSMTFHNNIRVGNLISRLVSDTANLQGLMADTLLSFFQNILTFLIGAGALFLLHWKLALLSLTLLPFFIYSIYFFSGRIRERSKTMQEKIVQVFNIFFETLYSLPLVKSFCLEKVQANKSSDRLNDYFYAHLNLTKISLLSASITSFIGAMGPLLILWFGGIEIMQGRLSLGSFVAFNAFLGYLYGPVQIIMGLNTTVQASFVSLKRVFEIFAIPKEDANTCLFVNLNRFNGKIKYENVTFSYDGKKPAIKNISVTIEKGEKIALVGKSGSGKTTFVNLLLKFYKPQAGDIFIDDINIKDIKFDNLRQRIGIVQQNPIVFSGSIKENIQLGNTTASEEEIISAARIANLYDFIMSLPKRFDTEVGERGVKLSGGERQKLAIARVILKNPDILIFDEATSEIDSDSERLIQEAMNKVIKDKTVIFISHRLSSILHAEKIIFMEEGAIKGIGSHIQLYETIPSYKKIYDEQFKIF